MKLAETRLDEHAVADVIELYYSHPKLHIGRNVFIDMILHCPPKVTLKSLPGAVSRELDMLLAFRYREAAGALYDWSKMFGVCPYKMVRVPGSDVHAYPVVPDLGTGFIVTYVGKDERQHFKWYVVCKKTSFFPEGASNLCSTGTARRLRRMCSRKRIAP